MIVFTINNWRRKVFWLLAAALLVAVLVVGQAGPERDQVTRTETQPAATEQAKQAQPSKQVKPAAPAVDPKAAPAKEQAKQVSPAAPVADPKAQPAKDQAKSTQPAKEQAKQPQPPQPVAEQGQEVVRHSLWDDLVQKLRSFYHGN